MLGTMLGLFSIVLLQNGLRRTVQPAELAGILTGALLIGTITVELFTRQSGSTRRTSTDSTSDQ